MTKLGSLAMEPDRMLMHRSTAESFRAYSAGSPTLWEGYPAVTSPAAVTAFRRVGGLAIARIPPLMLMLRHLRPCS